MEFLNNIRTTTIDILAELYGHQAKPEDVLLNPTRKEFDGDYTIVVFPYVKFARSSPEKLAHVLGEEFVARLDFVTGFNVIKGFLNLDLANNLWHSSLEYICDNPCYGTFEKKDQKVLVEFSSPNTNKPLHMGHLRNILLGWSCSKILEANGHDVIKCQIVNDRGIAICKSMLAWKKFGNGETPESSGIKSDFFVGNFYVEFERKFQQEYKEWQSTEKAKEIFESEQKNNPEQDLDSFFKDFKNQYFNLYSKLGAEAKEMLIKWENGDSQILDLWSKMNNWVYDGHNVTYKILGVHFDKNYYESDTYLLGKETIKEGLDKGVFYKKEDGSVWVDLEDVGMDQKLVLRSDGTSVYMTQDLGTAKIRFENHGTERMVYVVADEQDYHFKALFEILKKLDEPYADGLYHLSYGMIDLPSGKMKSREGTVVDADVLIAEVNEEAKANSLERGEISDLPEEEMMEIIKKISLAALKFFIIKVNPRKRMVFDPKESVDMHGQTGPYIQNAYVRIRSVLRKAGKFESSVNNYSLADQEKDLVRALLDYPETVRSAGKNYDPSLIANFCYSLAKEYHRFYQSFRILNAESEEARIFRLNLSKSIAQTLKRAMNLLGIEMPEKM